MNKLLTAALNFIWYLKSRYWHKHHLIDLRKSHSEYKWGFVEPNEQILLANFTILVEYVKNLPIWYKQYEKPSRKDFDSDATFEMHLEQWNDYEEMMALYHWWVYERPSNLAKADMLLREATKQKNSFSSPANMIFYDRYIDFQEKLEIKEQEMLLRLIELRNYLWT